MFFHLVLGQIPPSILLCWGYWDHYLESRGERVDTNFLMDDQDGGKMWAREKHTRITPCYYGIECRINGTYKHIHCKRVFETGILFYSFT